jgi:hypothetical protein
MVDVASLRPLEADALWPYTGPGVGVDLCDLGGGSTFAVVELRSRFLLGSLPESWCVCDIALGGVLARGAQVS